MSSIEMQLYNLFDIFEKKITYKAMDWVEHSDQEAD